MSLLERIRRCHRHDLAQFLSFRVGDRKIGHMRRDFADRLAEFPSVFHRDESGIAIAAHLDRPDYRSAAIDTAMRELKERGLVPGWRNEMFAIAETYAGPTLFELERALVPAFGVKAYGVHLNGYVRLDGEIHLWVARRSADRPIEPGKLDHLVAGGLPAGIRPFDNLIKEAAEEAGLPKEWARRAKPAGALSYRMTLDGSLRDDTLFVYDLELPFDFRPRNQDGELSGFELWPLARVESVLAASEDFKFNVALVVIDFMIRHGHLTPQRPDYVDLCLGLARNYGI